LESCAANRVDDGSVLSVAFGRYDSDDCFCNFVPRSTNWIDGFVRCGESRRTIGTKRNTDHHDASLVPLLLDLFCDGDRSVFSDTQAQVRLAVFQACVVGFVSVDLAARCPPSRSTIASTRIVCPDVVAIRVLWCLLLAGLAITKTGIDAGSA